MDPQIPDLHEPRSPSAGPSSRTGPATQSAASRYGVQEIGTEVHLSDYIRVLYKRRWTGITALAVVVISVSAYTFTATPIYEAKAELLIEKESANVVDFKEAYEQNQIADDYYQTQYKILQSRALARLTIETLKFWGHPQFAPVEESATKAALMTPIRAARAWLGTPSGPAIPDAVETREQSRVIDQFLANLTIVPVRNSRLVEVRYRSSDPAMAANIANSLAKQYIEQNLSFKFMSTREASDWLAGQLAEQRKQVETSEQALQKYREQTDSVSLEDRQNITVQKLADLNAAVTKAKTERIQKEAAYEQIRGLQPDRNARDTIPAILSNAFIQQQKAELASLQQQQAQQSEKLGPRHPDMVKLSVAIESTENKIQGEIAKIVQSMRNDYQAAVAQERSLMTALEQQKNEALALSRKGIDYGVLQRDAATNRQIFDSLMQRTKETGISGELKTSNIRVVDPAEVPRQPASPNTRTNLLLALFGGMTLAVGLTFFFEYLDNCIKTPDDLKMHLGLPFLGMVPALFDAKGGTPLLSKGVAPNFGESLRAVRTNVLFSSAEPGGRSLVVTSTGPAEGKTAVASNLAISLAHVGQRVLLVDADMRRPRVHTVFEREQEPGLSNVLAGTARASQSVQPSGTENLWVLPAGFNPPNPAELLASPRFADFVKSLTENFDWVIIDTPPVLAVTDSSIVANLASGVVFVVGAEMTSRYAAKQAIEQLHHVHARFVGAVLNRVDLQHNAYYYSQHYRREYSGYYLKGPSA